MKIISTKGSAELSRAPSSSLLPKGNTVAKGILQSIQNTAWVL
jgi:hypothetical protein